MSLRPVSESLWLNRLKILFLENTYETRADFFSRKLCSHLPRDMPESRLYSYVGKLCATTLSNELKTVELEAFVILHVVKKVVGTFLPMVEAGELLEQ